NFLPPAQSPLSESGAWLSPINRLSDVALQKDGSNRVYPTATNNDAAARYVGVTFSGDQFSQAKISNKTGNTVEGVLVRIQSNSNAGSYALVNYYSSFYSLLRINDDNTEMKFVQNSDSFGGGRLADYAVTP